MRDYFRFFVTAGMFLVAPTLLFAHGKNDITERSVNQDESWREIFDLAEKKEGKYNIMVTAEDNGGNIGLGGPFNIYIDPESDLPVIGITNPSLNMRVPGNLNIVGTCVDDDGVKQVELILDGDYEHPQLAEGKEFWSYYLDTNELTEGPHTIEVYGTDINGLRGHSTFTTWNLDRRQPITGVTNYTLGALVSGKINLKGTIFDGNGIKMLSYSLDNGQIFREVKISENKKTGNWEFSCPIDTRLFKDGPSVCWFRATDKMGSVGIYSFLYFIDNTEPDVRIVSPQQNEVCNGRFGIAGYAKDAIGIQKLTWTFAGESGEFELIPGNPYWYKEVDTTGMTAKTVPFTISALDLAGNLVEIKQDLPLNQELDKPVVTIAYPVAGELYEGTAGSLFMRGIVTDDDGGISSVQYTVDDGEEKTLSAQGVFCTPIAEESDLTAGAHTITVTATDKYGVVGNPVSVTFEVKGAAPVLSPAQIQDADGVREAYPGIQVHPENNAYLQTTLTADAGIQSASYRVEWGSDGRIETELELSQKRLEKTLPISIPLADVPWGLVRITITATDVCERVVSQTSVLHMRDLTTVQADLPEVVFNDSSISDSGYVECNPARPLTGFFLGGTIREAALVPETPFATLSVSGNLLSIATTSQEGYSEPVRVRVVTDQGVSYTSREMIFYTAGASTQAPVVALADSARVFSSDEVVHITGSVQSVLPVSRVCYRVFSVPAVMQNGVFSGSVSKTLIGEYINVALEEDNTFAFDINPENYAENGMYVIEVSADNGKRGADAVFMRRMEPLPEGDEKTKIRVASPAFTLVEGIEAYCVVNSQESLDSYAQMYRRGDLVAGRNDFVFSVNDVSASDKPKKPYSTKITLEKECNAVVYIDSIGDKPFANGMEVPLPRIVEKGSEIFLKARIISDSPVTEFRYEFTGEKMPGGSEEQHGKVAVQALSETEYEALVPLQNMSARLTTATLTAQTAAGSASYRGSFAVVRERDAKFIDNEKKIYWLPQENTGFDAATNTYTIATGTRLAAYANVPTVASVGLNLIIEALKLETEGNSFDILPTKDGFYKDVIVRVCDSQGVEYVTAPINLQVNSAGPEIVVVKPEMHQWVQGSFELAVGAYDENGVASVEYTLDGGEVWKLLSEDHGEYKATVFLDDMPDGLVSIDVRAKDNAGLYSYAHLAAQKDTTPPEVTVVVPATEDIINGENLIAFIAKDNGNVQRAEYMPPKLNDSEVVPVPLELAPMVTTMVGTEDKPLHDLMSVDFYDDAGNVASVSSWEFIIDAESDLPIAEIHVPEEEAVITRDFVVSGVVLDDDGASKIWYKIDDGEFVALPDYDNSFSINLELLSFTDNEHSITVFAEDIHGVKGPEYVRNFKVSLEEPKGHVETPPITETVKQTITLTGHATDKNGISAVYVSVDNGNSYNEARGTFGHEVIDSDWQYTFDTRVIEDGTHVVFLKIVDWYGIEGIVSSLINIDNTSPDIRLELPLDGSTSTGMVFFSGQTTDNVKLEKLYIVVRSLDGKEVLADVARTDLIPGDIITQAIDLSAMDDGFYNIEVTGEDAAENVTRVSRNIMLDKTAPKAKVDLLYPLNGEHVHGVFNIYGTAVSETPVTHVTLFIDGLEVQQTELSASGYYRFRLSPEMIAEGQHTTEVHAILQNGQIITSNRQYLNYAPIGPWVTIDNFTYGDFAIDRPYLRGDAGYAIAEEELIAAKSKDVAPELRAAVLAKAVDKVELSLDNGKTFETVSNGGKWRYRVENKDIAEGYHFLLVRATMKNGETAVTRTIVQVDSTAPTVRLISPGVGGRYNQELVFSGLTHDDVALKDVKLYLRKGDKASYEVPGFIQGLYMDWHFWGGTLFDIGFGLTFFDDNVKLQVQWGQFTEQQWSMFKTDGYRYGGDSIFGAKILANVYYLPFRFLLGPDWEWLSMNVAVGANFTRFSDSGAGTAQILSAALAQIEFPRVTFDKQKMFRTIAFYTEGQLWFIPSDVSSDDIPTIVPQISCGIRVNVF